MDWAKKLAELQQQRAALMGEMSALVEVAERANRGLEEAEQVKFNEKKEEVRKVDERIVNVEAMLKEARNAAAVAKPATPAAPAAAAGEARVEVIPNGREHLPFNSQAEFFTAVRNQQVTGRRDERFDIIIKAAEERATAQGFNLTLPSDGGVMVQSDVSNQLLQSAQEGALFYGKGTRLPLSEGAQILKLLYVKDMDRSNGSVTGGLKWYSTSEAQQATKSQLEFLRVSMELKKLTGLFYATEEVLRNGAALVSVVNKGFKDELGPKLDNWIVYGNGNDEGVGLLTAANQALITVSKESGQSADTFLFENANKMRAQFKGNGNWYMNQDVDVALPYMEFDTSTGNAIPVYLPANGIAGQVNGVLSGRPTIQTDLAAAAIGDLNDIFLVDPAEHYIIDQGTVDMQSSIHVRFLEGETAFRFVYFCDTRPTWYDKKTGRNGDVVSPYVRLEAR